jgi:SAM-dependent methyltransferase
MNCPVCGSSAIENFISISEVPVHNNIQWSTKEEALSATRGDIELTFCHECGHIYNVAFDPSRLEYTDHYENSLHYSSEFRRYAERIVDRLIEKHKLRNKNVIEIGCGKGDFLALLCNRGNNKGLGFDKSFDDTRVGADSLENVKFIRDFYSTKYAKYDVDFICCRHVLEHVENPRGFLEDILMNLKDRPGVNLYFEVPNVLFMLGKHGIWDLIYEHFSYFSPDSLVKVFQSSGFTVTGVFESFKGQFLIIDALSDQQGFKKIFDYRKDIQNITKDINAFQSVYSSKIAKWNQWLKDITHKGKRAVIWGAGSKGVTFLNVLKTRDKIQYIVDLNPHKHDKYVSGTGQRIVAPAYLKHYQPDYVVVMNDIYKDEIERTLGTMKIESDVMCA